jgi:hypothetical protein
MEKLEHMLLTKDASHLPIMAPPGGLMLADIKYPDTFAVLERSNEWFWKT